MKVTSPGGDGKSKGHLIGRLRIGDLNKLFALRYGGRVGVCDWVFPDDDAGLEDLKILLHHYRFTYPNSAAIEVANLALRSFGSQPALRWRHCQWDWHILLISSLPKTPLSDRKLSSILTRKKLISREHLNERRKFFDGSSWLERSRRWCFLFVECSPSNARSARWQDLSFYFLVALPTNRPSGA